MDKIVCWWSGGVTSAVACSVAIELFGLDDCELVMMDTMNEPPIEPKIYKNGYEVVRIGGCEYLRDVGFFHETLVHDGECQNHCK